MDDVVEPNKYFTLSQLYDKNKRLELPMFLIFITNWEPTETRGNAMRAQIYAHTNMAVPFPRREVG